MKPDKKPFLQVHEGPYRWESLSWKHVLIIFGKWRFYPDIEIHQGNRTSALCRRDKWNRNWFWRLLRIRWDIEGYEDPFKDESSS